MYKRSFSFWPAALLMVLVALALTAPQAVWACGGGIICVDADAPGPSFNGLSWTTAYTNVQDALAAATNGNEIWVAEGVYYPDEGGGQAAGDPAASFFLKSDVAIYGGFAATETERLQRDWDTHITVLSGDLAGNDTADAHGVVLRWTDVVTGDNSYQVVSAGGYQGGTPLPIVKATAVLDGFTITAGLDTRSDGNILHGIGAGLFTYQSAPTLNHLVFSGNRSTLGGAIYLWQGDGGAASTMTDVAFTGNTSTAVYCRDTWVTMNQVVFQDNSGGSGGGLILGDCGLNLTDAQFTGNTADSGGGLSLSGGQAHLNRVVFDSNQAGTGGGLNAASGSLLTLTAVTFENNIGRNYGGGAYIQMPAQLNQVNFIGNSSALGGGMVGFGTGPIVITNALFAGNTANEAGGGLLSWWTRSLTVTNAVFQGNAVTTDAWGYGGGALEIWAYDASNYSTFLQNVTVSGNSAPGSIGSGKGEGGGIHANNGILHMHNSIVYSNTNGDLRVGGVLTTTYSIVGGGCPGGATCDHVIDADPAFILPVAPGGAPTTTGDLRLQLTSPAIDAGDNSAVPAGLTTDLDGNPRLVDTSAVADTGSGTPPIVDRGAYEYPGKPDLEVSKTNNVGGVVAANTPFSWTLTISNTGGDIATFAANTVILQDDLPSANASYGASASIQNATGLSGPIACTVSAYTLICRANGGAVTLAAAGRFTVAIPVNTSGIPILVNPRSGGVCRVDPNNVISELLENNNTCNSDTVAVGQTSLTVDIHDAGHTPIVQAPIGAMIHVTITVTGIGATPTGATHLYRYNNSTCSGSPTHTNNQELANGAVESAGFAATSFYYRVLYSGDSTHEAVYSPCTQFRAYQTGPTFTVNTPADDDNTVDGFLCSDIHCTLREAILAANAATGANTILFAVGSGQTITLTSAPPAINDTGGELTIDGQTYAVTVSGNDQYRLFTVNNNIRATLANLTLVHGNYTGGDCGLRSCGGGLKVEAGAAVTLTHSAILSSTATGSGGGIYNLGTLIIQQSTLAGSSADEGGGILNGGTLLVRQSTLAGNAALYGGGILVVTGGTVTLENSTLSGNTATGTDSTGGGGAIDLYDGTAVITNSTIVSNTAVSPNQAKSGLWLENGTLSLHNSIVADNNGANNFYRTGGTFTSQGYNLADAWNGLSNQSTDLTGDPKLGPLADNGGATLTHMPLTGSPAIEGGNPGYCPAADQRGIARPQGLRCDIGAVEGTASLWMTKSVVPAGNVPYHGVVTYTIVLTNAGGAPAANLSLTDTLPAGLAFGQWLQQPGSGLVQTGGAITWTGTLAANTALPLSFTATHTGNSFDVIANTAFFSGTLQSGSAAATFNVLCLNTITVQNTDDSGPGSLRQAIADVCDGGTIDFAPTLAGQTITLTSAELTIAKTVTLTNPHALGLQLSGNNARRVFSIQATGVVTLSSLAVVNGMADYGGGIVNEGVLVINAGIFSSNRASGEYFDTGGAIYNAGILTINASTFSGNQADYGGGVTNYGTLTVNASTFSSNQAGSEGGGINNQATLTVNASTFSGNQADYGGGIINNGTLHLRNSIIANSPAGGDCRNHATIATNANNLIEATGSDACGIASGVGGSLIGVDPLLAPLGDRGGATQTFALLPGSPAIDAGSSCLATDQRGIVRPQGSSCDIGAFESQGFTLTYTGGSGQITSPSTAFANPLALTVSSSAGEPVDGGQVVFTGPASGAALSSSPLTAPISGGAASPVVTANAILGSYSVTATTQGGLNTISYSLTNAPPEIAVIGNGQVIDDGDSSPSTADHTDFGSVGVGQTLTRTFTISNSSGSTLSLTGTPAVSLGGAAAFSVVAQPATSVGPYASVTFHVRFTPSVTGTQVATVTIANDDADEAPYDFTIRGTGTANQAPVANAGSDQSVSVGAVVTLDGSASTDPDGHTPLSYDWTQTGGPAVAINNTAAVSPTFTAPGTPTVLTFTLWVTDAYGLPALVSDAVSIIVNDAAVSGLAVTTASPTLLGQATTFTVTAQGSNLVYTWNFGDGSPVVSGASSTVIHTYPAAAAYTAVITATNGSNSQQVSVSVQVYSLSTDYYLYLPVVQNAYTVAPDLVVEHLTATANTVEVVIKNQGNAPVVGSFWVDVYLNPATAPTQVNQTWPHLGAQGLVWGVTSSALPVLTPGGVLTLTVGDAYYYPDLSQVSWPLAAGTPTYAQVDSANADTTYGGVFENHEIIGGPYNNISQAVSTFASNEAMAQPVVDGSPSGVVTHSLPRRP